MRYQPFLCCFVVVLTLLLCRVCFAAEPIRFGVQAADNNGSGVIVERVFEDHAGHKAGLKRGDVILAINGKKVATEQEYSDAVDASGKTMLLMLRKAEAGNVVTIAVELPMPAEQNRVAPAKPIAVPSPSDRMIASMTMLECQRHNGVFTSAWLDSMKFVRTPIDSDVVEYETRMVYHLDFDLPEYPILFTNTPTASKHRRSLSTELIVNDDQGKSDIFANYVNDIVKRTIHQPGTGTPTKREWLSEWSDESVGPISLGPDAPPRGKPGLAQFTATQLNENNRTYIFGTISIQNIEETLPYGETLRGKMRGLILIDEEEKLQIFSQMLFVGTVSGTNGVAEPFFFTQIRSAQSEEEGQPIPCQENDVVKAALTDMQKLEQTRPASDADTPPVVAPTWLPHATLSLQSRFAGTVIVFEHRTNPGGDFVGTLGTIWNKTKTFVTESGGPGMIAAGDSAGALLRTGAAVAEGVAIAGIEIIRNPASAPEWIGDQVGQFVNSFRKNADGNSDHSRYFLPEVQPGFLEKTGIDISWINPSQEMVQKTVDIGGAVIKGAFSPVTNFADLIATKLLAIQVEETYGPDDVRVYITPDLEAKMIRSTIDLATAGLFAKLKAVNEMNPNKLARFMDARLLDGNKILTKYTNKKFSELMAQIAKSRIKEGRQQLVAEQRRAANNTSSASGGNVTQQTPQQTQTQPSQPATPVKISLDYSNIFGEGHVILSGHTGLSAEKRAEIDKMAQQGLAEYMRNEREYEAGMLAAIQRGQAGQFLQETNAKQRALIASVEAQMNAYANGTRPVEVDPDGGLNRAVLAELKEIDTRLESLEKERQAQFMLSTTAMLNGNTATFNKASDKVNEIDKELQQLRKKRDQLVEHDLLK